VTTPDSLKALIGKRVALDLSPAADSALVRGKLLGTIDAADGLVLIVEPDEAPGTRRSVHSHHVTKAQAV
jgi:hypothetical protein